MITVDFSEAIAASDLKVSRSRHLIEYMKICEYSRSRSYLDFGPRSCTYKNLNWIFSETIYGKNPSKIFSGTSGPISTFMKVCEY